MSFEAKSEPERIQKLGGFSMNKTPEAGHDQVGQAESMEQSTSKAPQETTTADSPPANPLPWLIRNLCNRQSMQSGAGDRPVAG